MLMVMGKDYIDNRVKLFDAVDNQDLGTVPDYFTGLRTSRYSINAISGGGGGVGDTAGSATFYWPPGDHGSLYQSSIWADRDDFGFDGSFRWFYIGGGGSPGDSEDGGDGGFCRIVLSGGSSLFNRNGGAGGVSGSPSTDPGFVDAGTSPWTTAGLDGTWGRGGDGAQGGGGRIADSGTGGRITVQRVW